MPTATEKDILAAKAAQPGAEIELIEHPKYADCDLIARPPTGAEWRIFLAKSRNPAEEMVANMFLVDACSIWPDKEARGVVIAARPAIEGVWAVEIGEMAGSTARATRKKL